jgi:hypothetical protein
MVRMRIGLVAALSVLASLVAGQSATAASSSPSLAINSAELVLTIVSFGDQINVTGTGVCDSAGTEVISVDVSDVETGGHAMGQASETCTFPGEHINWMASPSGANFRAGDHVLVEATSVGAIDGSDERVLTLKKFR